MATNSTLDALRRGEIVNSDGLQLRMRAGKASGDLLQVGDMYFAHDSIHTVASIHSGNGVVQQVESVQGAKRFDPTACVGVEVIGITSAFDTAETLTF